MYAGYGDRQRECGYESSRASPHEIEEKPWPLKHLGRRLENALRDDISRDREEDIDANKATVEMPTTRQVIGDHEQHRDGAHDLNVETFARLAGRTQRASPSMRSNTAAATARFEARATRVSSVALTITTALSSASKPIVASEMSLRTIRSTPLRSSF